MADTYTFRINAAAARQEAQRIYADIKSRDLNGDGVSQDEIPQMPADTFNKMAKNGRITVDSLCLYAKNELLNELQATLRQELPKGRDTLKDAQVQYDALVQKFDKDKDGKVSRDEYVYAIPYGGDWKAAEKEFDRLAQGGTHVTVKGVEAFVKVDNPRFTVHRIGNALEVELVLGDDFGKTLRGDARHAFANWVNMDLKERAEGKWGMLKLPTPVQSQENAIQAGYNLLDKLGLKRELVDIDYSSDYFFKVRDQLPTYQPQVTDPTQWYQNLLPKILGGK